MLWHADAASITWCNGCCQGSNKFLELQLLGKSMPALFLLPVAMTGAAMTTRSKASSMSLGSFDSGLLYQDLAVQ